MTALTELHASAVICSTDSDNCKDKHKANRKHFAPISIWQVNFILATCKSSKSVTNSY